jgi:hypothetical protein
LKGIIVQLLTHLMSDGGLSTGVKVIYPSKLALIKTYLSAPSPIAIYRHGLAKSDVRQPLERETNRVITRWLDGSNPPISKPVAGTLLHSHQCVASLQHGMSSQLMLCSVQQ